MASRILTGLRQPLMPLTRRYATVEGSSASAGTHEGGAKRWAVLSIVVALPAVGVCWINSYLKEKEHHAHHERPEFKAYDHLRLRSKAFPWGNGDRSLFHNKEINAVTAGYED